MSDHKVARYNDGKAYSWHKQYLGNGIMRSCGKCGKHGAPGDFKKWRVYWLCCSACRGVTAQEESC